MDRHPPPHPGTCYGYPGAVDRPTYRSSGFAGESDAFGLPVRGVSRRPPNPHFPPPNPPIGPITALRWGFAAYLSLMLDRIPSDHRLTLPITRFLSRAPLR
jgi:hypothetical protein